MPAVSVALATFNGERYLASQLESLANQTAPPHELVVVDDASSDDTIKIIQSFAAKMPFEVRLAQNQAQLGYRENFMKAAALCNCDLVAFCDQDDVWHPEKLARMQRAFEQPDVLLAYHNSELIDEGGAGLGTVLGKHGMLFGPLKLWPWTIIPGHAQVFRRSLLRFTPLHSDSFDPYATDQLMPHDQWSVLWASVLGRIIYLPDVLARYRQHSDNVSGWPHLSLSNYLSDHISNAAKYATGECAAAKNRLELLRRSLPLLSPDEAAHVSNAATSYYETLIGRSELRAKIYTSKRPTDRARALIELMRRGAYVGKKSETFGFPALLLDSAIGVPFSRLGR